MIQEYRISWRDGEGIKEKPLDYINYFVLVKQESFIDMSDIQCVIDQLWAIDMGWA